MGWCSSKRIRCEGTGADPSRPAMNFAFRKALPSCLRVDVFCPIVHVLPEFGPLFAGRPESLSDRLMQACDLYKQARASSDHSRGVVKTP